MEAPGPQDRGQFPRSLTNHVSYGQVHPEFAVEADSEQLERVSMRLGVRLDVRRFLRWVKKRPVLLCPICATRFDTSWHQPRQTRRWHCVRTLRTRLNRPRRQFLQNWSRGWHAVRLHRTGSRKKGQARCPRRPCS